MDLDSITHVFYAFHNVDSYCDVVSYDPYADFDVVQPEKINGKTVYGNIAAFRELRDMQRAKGRELKLIHSLGGWTLSNYFSGCAKTPEKRAKVINSAIATLQNTKFDGIDVDWEYPVCCGESDNEIDPDDWLHYVTFLQEFRAALDAAYPAAEERKELSIAMGMSHLVTGVAPKGDLGAVLDGVMLMTYDYNGAWQPALAAHNAPLYPDPAYHAAGGPTSYNIDWGVNQWLEHVPGSKIFLGLPAYARGWVGVSTEYGTTGTGGVAGTPPWLEEGILSYWDIASNYLSSPAYTKHWNDVAKVPYLTSSNNGGTFISYDSEQSIINKVQYAKMKGLGGLMWWEASEDRNNVLVKLATDEWNRNHFPPQPPSPPPAPSPPPGTLDSPPPSPPPPKPSLPPGDGTSTAAALVAAVGAINHVFQTLKSTASDGCQIDSAPGGACWMDSTEYFWADLVSALEAMSVTGIAGRTFYAGPPGGESKTAYGLANLAAFLSQTMQETIQYDACDENNWSNQDAVNKVIAAGGNGGDVYPATAACGQLGQSYQDYHCSDMTDPETGEAISAADLECAVDLSMVLTAKTHAKWYGAPPPLFCAPKQVIPEAPRWDVTGWCPTEGVQWDQNQHFSSPFDTMPRGQIHYGPGDSTSNVPQEVLAEHPTYLDYVKNSYNKGTGEACLMAGECCMDMDNHRAGSWKTCPGGCENGGRPELEVGRESRSDVEGCCWWGRGAIQTTGVCNFGKLNYFAGKKAADRGRNSLFPEVDFCRNPGAICDAAHPELKWVAGFFYWLNDVQPYSVREAEYMTTLQAWVDGGMNVADHSLVDFASGVVNRGCHDAPFEGSGGPDPCGNGEIHAATERRKNFAYIWEKLSPAVSSSHTPHAEGVRSARVAQPNGVEPIAQSQQAGDGTTADVTGTSPGEGDGVWVPAVAAVGGVLLLLLLGFVCGRVSKKLSMKEDTRRCRVQARKSTSPTVAQAHAKSAPPEVLPAHLNEDALPACVVDMPGAGGNGGDAGVAPAAVAPLDLNPSPPRVKRGGSQRSIGGTLTKGASNLSERSKGYSSLSERNEEEE